MAESWNGGVRGEQVLPLINADAQTIRVEAGPGTGKTFGLVTWADPHVEANGMAEAIVANFRTNPDDRHLVMVTRRKFGFWLRDRIAAVDADLRVELSFSEGLLETWAVREAFLFFCLLVDPDRPTWRAWLAYKNSGTGEKYKAPRHNADAYLKLLEGAKDQITETTVEALTTQSRTKPRGDGGAIIWERAKRFLELRDELEDLDTDSPAPFLVVLFDPKRWTGHQYKDVETARLDMQLLLDKALGLLSETADNKKLKNRPGVEHLRAVAQRLRYQIAPREPFAAEGSPSLQVATLWGAKGVTAEHVYLLGACDEAVPGQRRDEYPGTDEDYMEEQRRLFYVSITRSKKTLVISRATSAATGDGIPLGAATASAASRWRQPRPPALHRREEISGPISMSTLKIASMPLLRSGPRQLD